jgi:DNA-binding transcriptional MerR regulator
MTTPRTATVPVTGRTIAEVATACGLTAHTLRYYERDGLMRAPVARSRSGHRRYTDDDVAWIRLVTRLRSTGMPISEVRAYTDLVRAGDGTEPERLELLRRHRRRVLDRLAAVQHDLTAIEDKIAVYAGTADGC